MMDLNKPFKLRSLIANQKWLWLLAWLLGVITMVSVLAMAMLAGWFIGMASAAGMIGGFVFAYHLPSLAIRILAITRTLGRYADLMVSHHAVFGLLSDLRVRFFLQWIKLPALQRQSGVRDGSSSSDKMQRLVNDIDVLDEFPLRVVSPFVVASIALLLMCMVVLWVMPILVLGLLPLFVAIVIAFWIQLKGQSKAKRQNELTVKRKNHLLNSLPALTQLVSWDRWQDVQRQMHDLDGKYQAHHRQTLAIRRKSTFAVQFLGICAVLSVLVLAHLALQNSEFKLFVDDLSFAGVYALSFVLAIVLGVFGSLEMLSALVGEPLALGKTLVAKQRLNGLLGEPVVTNKPVFEDMDFALNLNHLTVKNPHAVIAVGNINAQIRPKIPTLVVGASGAGKSTLLSTLAGELPLAGGEIEILQNQQSQDFFAVNFGKNLGYLGQSVDIFDQSLAQNLRLGSTHASDDELYGVLDLVGLTDWANSLPQGLDTPLGEYGMFVSGGQARRIALARLLLQPKGLLLLDEPFAGLDAPTRQIVWQSLINKQSQGDIGLLVIATHQIWGEMGEVDVLEVG